MIDGKKISAKSSKSWRNSINIGIMIPVKMRFCIECSTENCCDRCNIRVNENQEIKVDLGLLKRQAPNQFGHMLPYFEE